MKIIATITGVERKPVDAIFCQVGDQQKRYTCSAENFVIAVSAVRDNAVVVIDVENEIAATAITDISAAPLTCTVVYGVVEHGKPAKIKIAIDSAQTFSAVATMQHYQAIIGAILTGAPHNIRLQKITGDNPVYTDDVASVPVITEVAPV